MEPIKFKESNITFAKDQPEYLPLQAYIDSEGRVVTCWKLSIREKIKLLFTGIIWHDTLTFNNPLQPVFMAVNKDDIFVSEKDDK